MEKRINELNAHVVWLQSPFPVIDLVCYKDENALKKPNKVFLKRQETQKKRRQDIAYIDIDDLRNSLGYDESLPFARWSVMPSFNPFSGEKISPTRYNNNKIKKV